MADYGIADGFFTSLIIPKIFEKSFEKLLLTYKTGEFNLFLAELLISKCEDLCLILNVLFFAIELSSLFIILVVLIPLLVSKVWFNYPGL